MTDNIYKVIEIIGSSPNSWEEAARIAVEEAASHVRGVRVAEVDKLDMRIEEGEVAEYRAKVHVSFRYEGGA